MTQEIDIDQASQLFPQNNTAGNNSGGQAADANFDPVKDSDNWLDDVGTPGPASGQTTARENGTTEGGPAGNSENPYLQKAPQPMQPPVEFNAADLNVPEDIEADAHLMEAFTGLVGEMNLSQAQAQSLVDLQVQSLRLRESHETELRRQWREEIKTDPEYGGLRYESTVNDANDVLRRFDTDGQVSKTLVGTGFGDNPAVIKMLARIKRVIADDEFVSATGKAKAAKTLAEELWPDEVMGGY